MKRRLALIGCGLPILALVVLVAGVRLFVPWRHWQPPAVELPSPNAFDDYLRAGALSSENYKVLDPDDDPYLNRAARRRLLAENAEALGVLRAGFAHAYVEPREHAVAGDNAYYAHCRRLGRLLSLEATEHAANGRYAAALDSQLDAERLGFDLPRRTGVIGDLVSNAVRAIGRSEKVVQPRIDHLTAAEARAAASRLAGLLAGEQDHFQTFLDEGDIELATWTNMARSQGSFKVADNLADNGSSGPQLAWAVFGVGPWLVEERRYLAAAAAWAKLPWNAAPPPRPGLLFSMHRDEKNGGFARGVHFKRCQADACDQMFLAALALQAWRAEHGRYPDTLDALAPDILPAAPPDPFGRGPLKYRLDGEKYVLYSVGPDGVDDGGQPGAIQDEKTGAWRYNSLVVQSRGDLVWGLSEANINQPIP
jgi:hypothetical protein